MNRRFVLFCSVAFAVLACGDDDSVGDGGSDAAPDAAPEEGDAGTEMDAFTPPVFVPAATGCELLDAAEPVEPGEAPPAPDAFGVLLGPGGPATSFTAGERLVACAPLDGGERDRDHHNTVLMLDGHLWMPWAHEGGVGGLSVFEFDEPCAPVEVATTVEEEMRETHAAGIATIEGRRWMVTASMTGIMFWDVTDPAAPVMVTDMTLPGVTYPDSYARVVMSTFWQAPYVYAGASENGIYIVDASDPTAPELVAQYTSTVDDFRVGGVHAIGTLLAVLPNNNTGSALLDISDPTAPEAIPGASFTVNNGTTDRRGRPVPASVYFGHVNGDRLYYARNFVFPGGGGLVVYDISQLTAPRFVGEYSEDPLLQAGGYVFVKDDLAYVGLSGTGRVIDVSDPTAMTAVGAVDMTGDLDTLVPVGNVIVASVDDDAIDDEASKVFPFELEPDTEGPTVNMVMPRDGFERVALGARIGVTFDEPVDVASVFEGSFQLFELDESGEPVGGPVPGLYSGQEGVVNFAPAGPLKPEARYLLRVPAGGVIDASGNPTESPFEATFATVACE